MTGHGSSGLRDAQAAGIGKSRSDGPRARRTGSQLALALGLAAMLMPALSLPGEAAPRERKRDKEARGQGEKQSRRARPEAPPAPNGQMHIVVSLGVQRLTVYSDGRPIASAPISSGQPGHPTPLGVFSILQKRKWHQSNLYSNAPMPNMQRITWSGVALHAGHLPGYPASHGCIRLPSQFSQRLFQMTRIGARVIVARSQVAPVPFAHARLPVTIVPRPRPVEAVALAPPPRPVEADRRGGANADGALAQAEQVETAASAEPRSDRAGEGAAADDAERSVVASRQSGVPSRAPATLKTASLPEPAGPPPGPITVFVSRKEGKVLVRRDFEPLFEAPVAIARPEQPLGTHVYTAMALTEGGTGVRWSLITVPESQRSSQAPLRKGRRYARMTPAPSGPASDARDALDRISIDEDHLEIIQEMLTPGATLIISDHGLGKETGKGTDFVVLTR